MLKKPRVVLCVTAAILLGMLLYSRVWGQERAVPVTTARAESKEIYNSVTASGSIEAERGFAFCARGDAQVCEVYCQPGDAVQVGQALWQLRPADEPRWTAELLENAAALLSGSESCERIVTPLDGETVTVRAPADCTLLTAPVPGRSVPAGLPYAQAADLNALRLRVEIAEAFVADVCAGQQANITVSATGNRYAGRVLSVAPVARQAVSLTGSPGAVTVSALLQIEGADGALRPGYSASAKIFVDEKPAALVLPYEAVRQEGQSEYVYVVGTDGRARRRPISTGYALSSAVEITGGLTEGETVVVGSPEGLTDGALVEAAA